MKKILLFLALILLVSGLIFFDVQKSNNTSVIKNQPIPNVTLPKNMSNQGYSHIAIIVMENRSFPQIVDNPNAPYINSLIKQGILLSNYTAVTHPSLPNYIALIGGSTFGITSDCQNCFVQANNFLDQLEAHGKTWKAYMESMPSSCFLGSTNLYAQKHDPFVYFNDIRENKNRCKNVVALTSLNSDLSSASAPNFIWITPNICNDMHDCSTQTGDKWLSKEVPVILNSKAFKNGNSLLVITWDEAENSNSNRVPTIILGNGVKKGLSSNSIYNHYSLLHTFENLWGISPITEAVKNSAIIKEIML